MERNELKSVAVKMIGVRSSSWTFQSDFVALLQYAFDKMNLQIPERNILRTMLNEYHEQISKTWDVTAERFRTLYKISQKLESPAPSDIKTVINQLNISKTFSLVRYDPSFKAAIELLEFLYQNLDKLSYNRSTTISSDNDDQ